MLSKIYNLPLWALFLFYKTNWNLLFVFIIIINHDQSFSIDLQKLTKYNTSLNIVSTKLNEEKSIKKNIEGEEKGILAIK